MIDIVSQHVVSTTRIAFNLLLLSVFFTLSILSFGFPLLVRLLHPIAIAKHAAT